MAALALKKTVKTRKDHRCFGCLEKILTGSKAHIETHLGEDGAYSLYLCEECWKFVHEHRSLCEDCCGTVWEGWIGEARREAANAAKKDGCAPSVAAAH